MQESIKKALDINRLQTDHVSPASKVVDKTETNQLEDKSSFITSPTVDTLKSIQINRTQQSTLIPVITKNNSLFSSFVTKQ